MKISPTLFIFAGPLVVFLISAAFWFLILSQALNFVWGLVILTALYFLMFRWGLLISRRKGELAGLKSRKELTLISLYASLGLGELIWVISYLPFSIFVLAGLITVLFSVSFDVFKEHFKQSDWRRFLLKDVLGGAAVIILLILISPWLPRR